MRYTTETSTKWFPQIRGALPGLETTIRSDGSYGGDYQLLKTVWLIEHGGQRSNFSNFQDFWKELEPSPEDIVQALANPEDEFLHLLYCGLEIGRPISRHPLWDPMDAVADYRDPQVFEGRLSFHVYECSDVYESPPWTRIAKILFNFGDATFSREHVADLPQVMFGD